MKKSLTFVLLLSLSSIAFAGSSATVNLHAFPPPAGDAAVAYLRQVFGTVIDSIVSDSNARNAATDSTLGAMLQPFNSAVLFLGMLYMVYTTVKGTVDSAHDGEFLGNRMSSVWVPVRAVAGTGMLLPLASGYSLIQVLVLWLAIQGIGIGDATLVAGLDYVQSSSLVARPNLPETRPLAANILRFETCMVAMNQQYQASGRTTRITEQEHNETLSNTGEVGFGDMLTAGAAGAAFGPLGAMASAANSVANTTYTVTDYDWAANDNSYTNPSVCGSLSWSQSTASSQGDGNSSISKATIMQAHANGVRAMIASLRPVAAQIVAGQKPTPGAIEQAAATYENTLFAAAKTALDASNQSANRAKFLDDAKSAGWIYVATWYNQLIQLNDAMQSTLNTLPSSKPVSIDDKEIGDVLVDYRDAMTVADEYIKNHSAAVQDAYQQQADDAVTVPHSWEDMKRLLSRPAIAAINQFTQRLAGGNMSHVAQVKSVGDTIIGGGEALIAATFTANGLAASNASKLTIGNVFDIGAALSSISGMVTSLVLLVLGFGAVCAYYIPMIPYISGIAAVIKWFVLVFEAVIAAQLFGVAHAHPEGHDAVGQAGPGYMLLLGVAMRPALTVLGFFGSIWLAQPISEFVNLSYATAVAGAEHNSLTGIVGFIAYIAIYAIIMTTVMHGVFTLTNWVPDNVLRFIGGRLGADGVADKEPHEALAHFSGGSKNAAQGVLAGLGNGASEDVTPGASAPPLTDLLPNPRSQPPLD